jgi:hypothetical protein
MNQFIYYSCLVFIYVNILLSTSCSNKYEGDLIPKDKFVKIVTELHYADAVISEKGASVIILKDSLPPYYKYVLNKYQVSRSDFDNSLKYYSDNLDDLLLIYDEVIANINNAIPKKLNQKSIYKIFDLALEAAKIKTNPGNYFGLAGIELWTGEKNLSFSNKDTTQKANFKTMLKYHCLLMLKANISIYADDSSKNLRMAIHINYKDSSSDNTEKLYTKKDGKWKEYQLFLKTDSLKIPESVDCCVFQFDSLTGNRHCLAKKISLRQFAMSRDTSDLIIKESPKKTQVKKDTKKKKTIKKSNNPKTNIKKISKSLHQD